jgi:hypothetical protein
MYTDWKGSVCLFISLRQPLSWGVVLSKFLQISFLKFIWTVVIFKSHTHIQNIYSGFFGYIIHGIVFGQMYKRTYYWQYGSTGDRN